MAREYFCAYHSYLDNMEELSDAECGRLFKACILYDKTGELMELRGNEKYVFPGMRAQIDRDKNAYIRKCQQNSVNRRSTTVDDRQRTSTKSTKEKEKEKEKENKEKTSSKRNFVPPSVEEVAQYCGDQGYHVDPAEFVDHYQANGWMRGKTKLSDWKAAVRTWERRRKKDATDDYWA